MGPFLLFVDQMSPHHRTNSRSYGPNVSTIRLTVGPILLVTDNEDMPTTLNAGLDPFSHLL